MVNGKTIIIFLLIAGLLLGGLFFTARKDAVYMDVKLNLTRLEGTDVPRIDNLTASLVPIQKVSEPRGTNIFSPGLVALPLQNDQVIGYWTSVPYNGTGNYDLKVGLTRYPKKGDQVLINLRILDSNGTEINSLTYSTQLE